jgi:hypothetical protein
VFYFILGGFLSGDSDAPENLMRRTQEQLGKYAKIPIDVVVIGGNEKPKVVYRPVYIKSEKKAKK